MTPRVSVVMAVRNGAEYAREAVDSILGQSLRELEFIVVDNASTDETRSILATYRDTRLRVLSCEAPGLAPSLNLGIRNARATAIARMDADDVAEPTRLERQLAFLVTNDDHVLVGSDVNVIDAEGAFIYRANMPTTDSAIRRCLDRQITPFFHGAVMFRRDAAVAAGLYDERIPLHVEDILFWFRLAPRGLMANVSEPLYRYRLRPLAVSRDPRFLKIKARVVSAYVRDGRVDPSDVHELMTSHRPRPYRRARSAYDLDVGKLYLDEAKRVGLARRHFARSVVRTPFSARAWANLAVTLSPPGIRDAWSSRRLQKNELRTEAHK